MKGRDFRSIEAGSNGDRNSSHPPNVINPEGILARSHEPVSDGSGDDLVPNPAPVLREESLVPAKKGYSLKQQVALGRLQLKQLERELEVAQEQHDVAIETLLADQGRTLSRLASALSHELNSPLAALMSSLQTISTVVEKGKGEVPHEPGKLDTVRSTLCQNALLAGERIRQIVRRIQRFAGSGSGQARPADLNALLQDVVDIVIA